MAKGQQQPTQTTNNNATSTTQQNLSPEQQSLLGAITPAFSNFAAWTPQRYQGSTVAGFDPAQTQGQNMALGAAGAQQTLADNAANAVNFYTSGNIWDPAANPHLQGAIDASTRPITDNLTRTQLPSIRGEAIKTGNFGSSRQGIAEGLAQQGASQAIGDTASKLVQDQYRTNVQAQLQATGMVPTVQQAQLAPALTTSGVGDVRQALAQALLGEQAGNFNLDQMLQIAPYLQAKDLLGVLQGLPGGSTTTSSTGTGTSTANVPQPNRAMQALGGAATGASLGSMFGPIGTGVGAAGGAVLPFLFG